MRKLFIAALLCAPCFAMPGKHEPRQKDPDPPQDAVVWSLSPSKGHAQGVVIESNKFVTARHYGTPVGCEVYVIRKDGTRFVTTVISKATPDLQVTKAKLAKEPKLDRYWYGDIAVCVTREPFPVAPVEVMQFGSGKVTAMHKDGSFAVHSASLQNPNWLQAQANGKFAPGDSGLPWFFYKKAVRKWYVVGITSRSNTSVAESPRLGSKLFKPYL